MNKELSVVLLAIGFSALVGCSAAGVVASSDPSKSWLTPTRYWIRGGHCRPSA